MEDIKFYEFLLKLNTYLNRMNVISNKFMEQEQRLGEKVLMAKTFIAPEIFESIFKPMASELDKRVELLSEMQEANNEFEKTLHEYYTYFKGIVQ